MVSFWNWVACLKMLYFQVVGMAKILENHLSMKIFAHSNNVMIKFLIVSLNS